MDEPGSSAWPSSPPPHTQSPAPAPDLRPRPLLGAHLRARVRPRSPPPAHGPHAARALLPPRSPLPAPEPGPRPPPASASAPARPAPRAPRPPPRGSARLRSPPRPPRRPALAARPRASGRGRGTSSCCRCQSRGAAACEGGATGGQGRPGPAGRRERRRPQRAPVTTPCASGPAGRPLATRPGSAPPPASPKTPYSQRPRPQRPPRLPTPTDPAPSVRPERQSAPVPSGARDSLLPATPAPRPRVPETPYSQQPQRPQGPRPQRQAQGPPAPHLQRPGRRGDAPSPACAPTGPGARGVKGRREPQSLNTGQVQKQVFTLAPRRGGRSAPEALPGRAPSDPGHRRPGHAAADGSAPTPRAPRGATPAARRGLTPEPFASATGRGKRGRATPTTGSGPHGGRFSNFNVPNVFQQTVRHQLNNSNKYSLIFLLTVYLVHHLKTPNHRFMFISS